jgi:hypothetical protein
MNRSRRYRLRVIAVLLCLSLLASCQATVPTPPNASPNQRQTSGPVVTPSLPTASEAPSGLPTASEAPTVRVSLPQPIVSAIDAIIGAATPEAAIAATRVVLERSGVVISDDPATAAKSMAGIYVGTDQLAAMAYEAQSRATLSHVNFAQFAESFGGLALLPPNEKLLDQLSQPVASPSPNTIASSDMNLDGQGLRLSAVLTSWVKRSLENYPSDDPAMTALTAPALYLAELAARQDDPIDLREQFVPSHLQLGALDITLLVAGLRTALAVAAQQTGLRPAIVLASTAYGGGAGAPEGSAGLDPTLCRDVRRLGESQAPVITDVFTFTSSEAIKALAETSIRDMLGVSPNAAKSVGAAFDALGVIYRVQALWLLYHSTELTLRLEPTSMHKPLGVNAPVAAIFTAGVPDAAWDQAVADRNNSPVTTNLKECARLLGIPVTSDLVDIGDATSSWRVAWDITQGNEHATFEGCQFLPSCDVGAVATGRWERKLHRRNSHSGEDTVIVEILPEQESDHPGREVTAPVRVCAHLRTDKPPSTSTILNAAQAGVSGPNIGGAANLASAVADIMLSWWQFVFTLDECADMTVSFHVKQPGNWHGTVTVNYEEQDSSGIHNSRASSTTRTSLDVTDTVLVGGSDLGQKALNGMPVFVTLEAEQFTRGGYVREDLQRTRISTYSGCRFIEETSFTMSGTWGYNGPVAGGILLQIGADGKYTMSFSRFEEGTAITLPTATTVRQDDLGSDKNCKFMDTTKEGTRDVPNDIYRSGFVIEGQVDLASPNLQLQGHMTWPDPLIGPQIVTVAWNLTREPLTPTDGGFAAP